jgi:hypothetical protein
MSAKRCLQSVVGAALLLSMPGCATVMSGKHADVTFYSNVPNAHVAVRDKRGQQVVVTETGSTIGLKRKDRWIFPAKYTATIEAPGYQAVEVPIESTVNPWVFGNVAFLYGGFVGLAVDNATGAAWMPKESSIYQELSPLGGPTLYGATAQNSQQPVTGNLTAPVVAPSAVVPAQVAAAPGSTEPIVQTAAATNAVPAETTYR